MASSCSASPFSANLRNALFFAGHPIGALPRPYEHYEILVAKENWAQENPRRGETHSQEGLDRRNRFMLL